jgi:hypothetical protein
MRTAVLRIQQKSTGAAARYIKARRTRAAAAQRSFCLKIVHRARCCFQARAGGVGYFRFRLWDNRG